MKKILTINILIILILSITCTISYASNSTLSKVTNNLNSTIEKIQYHPTNSALTFLTCTATSTENKLNINLFKQYENQSAGSYEYSLSNNILSRTTSPTNTYEDTAYMLLLDCIGQIYGHNPGDLYYSLEFDNMSNYTLEKDGFSVKKLENETYELKADISKTIDMSNLYFTEADLENFASNDYFDTVHYKKGFLQFVQTPNWTEDTDFRFFIAERNNLTENTYKSLLSAINKVFNNSEDVLNYFKQNFPNLSVGSKKFDGFEITVAPTSEEADFEYWTIYSDESYKIVKVSINKKVINKLFNTITAITEEMFEDAIDNLRSYAYDSDSLDIELNKSTKQLILSSEEEQISYLINYDLTAKPTFSIDLVFKKDMTKEQCEIEYNKSSALVIPFVLISDIKGIEDYSDSMLYFYFSFLNTDFQLQQLPEYTNAINYAKLIYDSTLPYTFKDTLFTYTAKKISESSDEYKVTFTLVVNAEADFNIITDEGTFETPGNIQNVIVPSIQNSVNNYKNYIANEQNAITELNKTTNSSNKLPQTGNFFDLKYFLTLLIIVSSALLIVIVIKNIKYKNISQK